MGWIWSIGWSVPTSSLQWLWGKSVYKINFCLSSEPIRFVLISTLSPKGFAIRKKPNYILLDSGFQFLSFTLRKGAVLWITGFVSGKKSLCLSGWSCMFGPTEGGQAWHQQALCILIVPRHSLVWTMNHISALDLLWRFQEGFSLNHSKVTSKQARSMELCKGEEVPKAGPRAGKEESGCGQCLPVKPHSIGFEK